MKDLIDNIITFLKTAITNGDITIVDKTGMVYKGFSSMPDTPILASYITVDDGGESTDTITAHKTLMRYYDVIIEFGVYIKDREAALDDLLTLSDQIKAVLESETNRQKDGMEWGRNIDTFQVDQEDETFFRIRQSITRYYEIEDIYADY